MTPRVTNPTGAPSVPFDARTILATDASEEIRLCTDDREGVPGARLRRRSTKRGRFPRHRLSRGEETERSQRRVFQRRPKNALRPQYPRNTPQFSEGAALRRSTEQLSNGILLLSRSICRPFSGSDGPERAHHGPCSGASATYSRRMTRTHDTAAGESF